METKDGYRKYKDSRPEDTVNKLQGILHNAGLNVTYIWQNNEELACYSNRVQINSTGMGSNGKGTSRFYALASGYAELMERLQNGALYTGALDPAFLEETGMTAAPDERYEKAADLVGADHAMLDTFFQVNSCRNDFEKLICLQKWAGNHPVKGKGDDTLLTVPFLSLKKKGLVYLPYAIYTKMYGTNGMCAGNTPEEAMVQGLAEIFERYVNDYIICNPVTPPDIPEEILMRYPALWERIQRIEKDGQYRVLVKDCSLGKGYPVVSSVIINRKKGTFGFRIASHPHFPVALERTLTEAFQGRDLEAFTAINRIAPEAACVYKENLANIYKCGVGNFRKELFSDRPSYQFSPWIEKNRTNGEMLSEMIGLLLNEGRDILIRNVSFMGFPSYHIIVPGFSELYPVDELKRKEANTIRKISEGLRDFHRTAEEDAERILRLLQYKRNALFETCLSHVMKRPLNHGVPGGPYQAELLLAACCYRLGRAEEAEGILSHIEAGAAARNDSGQPYYRSVGLLLQLKYDAAPDDEIKSVLEKLAGAEMASKVLSEWADPSQVFRRLYPEFHCWDCGSCEAGEMCDYKNTEEVLRKIRKIYRENIPDQTELLDIVILQ